MEDIWQALEATTGGRLRDGLQIGRPANASARDVLNHRDYLMRFLNEIDGNLSVAEVRDALEEYQP